MTQRKYYNTRLMQAEKLLKSLSNKAITVLAESNGVADNEWTTEKGKVVPRWPLKSFVRALSNLEREISKISAFFDPSDQEVKDQWRMACSSASQIVAQLNEDASSGKNLNRAKGRLHRDIADAIFDAYRKERQFPESDVKEPRT